MNRIFADLFSGALPFPFDPKRPFWEALEALDEFFEDLLATQDKSAVISPYAELINPERIFIAKGVKIEGGTQIVGPVYIGQDVVISHGALVRSNTLLLKNSRVGHCSEVKRSILFPSAVAAHFNYVGDSILGQYVNLSAGAILCNQRLDKRKVRVEGEETLAPKLGAAVGDGARIGAGTICNPGAVIEKNAIVAPQSIVTGRFAAASA